VKTIFISLVRWGLLYISGYSCVGFSESTQNPKTELWWHLKAVLGIVEDSWPRLTQCCPSNYCSEVQLSHASPHILSDPSFSCSDTSAGDTALL
jgi:hypothetical protein